MKLNIVHLATDAIAGMPYRLVDALQRHSGFNVRLIETKKRNIYPQDLIFWENRDECIELLQNADIIHLHNNINLDSKDFNPVDLKVLNAKGVRFVRQFHSVPDTIARKMNCTVDEILSSTIPSLVIGQYPERYYPSARVIPNCIPLFNQEYRPSVNEAYQSDIFCSPSKSAGAWSDRWNTKGAPETKVLMQKLQYENGAKIKLLTNSSLQEVLCEKKHSFIVLDDMVTGSYHLSGLEGLSMGRPTMAYLDRRTDFLMRELSGATSVPFINVRLEEAEPVLKYLLTHRDEAQELGNSSRKWMEHYWSEEILMNHFVDMYSDLMKDPSLIARQPALSITNRVERFYSVTIPDIVYGARAKRAYFTNWKIRLLNSKNKFVKTLRRQRKITRKR